MFNNDQAFQTRALRVIIGQLNHIHNDILRIEDKVDLLAAEMTPAERQVLIDKLNASTKRITKTTAALKSDAAQLNNKTEETSYGS